MTTRAFLKRLLKEQPLRILAMVATLVAAGLLEGSSVALFVPLLQLISSGGQSAAGVGRFGRLTQEFLALFGLQLTVGSVLVLIFIVASGMQLAVLAQQKLSFRYQYLYEAALRERLYKAMFSAEWSFFLKQKTGDVTNALTTEVGRAGGAFYLINLLLAAVIVIFTYIGLAVVISWRMALAAAGIGTLVALALQGQITRATTEGADMTQANSDVQSEAVEQVSGAKLVKGCAVEAETISRFSGYLRSLATIQFRIAYNNARLKVIHDLSIAGLLCVGIYVAVAQLNMPIATLIVFLIIFYRLAPRLSNFQANRRNLLSNLPAFAVIDSLLVEAESMKERVGDRRFDTLTQGLVFRDVSFAYNPGHDVIKQLSLDIPKGKTVAIVGSSGAGKSTAVDLIMGLIYPLSGVVLVDGLPLSEYDLTSWRQRIGYVAQDAVLFHASVKANITWTSPEASDAEIKAAARSAYALDFIEQLPDGFDTIIGDRGVRLSGGQKQRLALARAIIRKPAILILDEATSALDAESEQKIQKAVESLAKTAMTIVIVTHRLATVRNANHIYVLENGELIEEGNWAMLAKSRGRFQTLKSLQALD